MLQRFHRGFLIFMSLTLIVIVLSACTKSDSTATTLETGVVTEATMTDTIETSGSVEAKQLATLGWSTDGNVLEVYVQNNASVSSGDELMKLESTSASTEVLEAVSTLVTAKQNLAEVQVSTSDLAEAEVALVDAKYAYEEVLKEYYLLDEPVGSEDYIAILKKEYIDAQKVTLRAYFEYNKLGDLWPEDHKRIAAYADWMEAKINEQDALARLTHFSNPPTAVLADEVRANLKLAKAEMDEAQRAYDELTEGNTDAVTRAQAAVDAAQTVVNQLSIIAPFDGEVAVVYSQEGDVVSKGTKALILVDRSKMFIDVLVDEDSIASVAVGNPVEITFDALGITTTGKVTLVNPIGTTSSNVVNYTVRIGLDEADPGILIGATASVVITTGEPRKSFICSRQRRLDRRPG